MCASAGATLAPLKVGLKFCMAYVFLWSIYNLIEIISVKSKTKFIWW
jgi:hypothetical protein